MKIGSFLAGSVLGLMIFGAIVAFATTLGAPGGMWWLIPGLPFVIVIGVLAAIDK